MVSLKHLLFVSLILYVLQSGTGNLDLGAWVVGHNA